MARLLLISTGFLVDAYRIQGVPETFFVARNGGLGENNIGPLSVPQLGEKIEELPAEQYTP